MSWSMQIVNNIVHLKTNDPITCGHIHKKSDELILCEVCANRLSSLSEEVNEKRKDLNNFLHTFNLLFRSENSTTTSSSVDKKCYKYIPISINEITYTFRNLLSQKFKDFYKEHMKVEFAPKTFLDAGSGHGNVMTLANGWLSRYLTSNEKFPPIQGVEFDPKNIKRANILLNRTNEYNKRIFKVIKGDIRTFKHYNKYDIIYFYVPLIDKLELNKFLDNLYTTAKPGTIILPFGARSGTEELWNKIKINFKNFNYSSYIMLKVK